MTSAARELEQVLERERLAAARADVDLLIALQDDKRLAIERLRQSASPPEIVDPLIQRARGNIGLIRQLVHCLGGILGEDSPVYSRDGATRAAPVRHPRGCI
ncbi:MAG: hypothetical protein HYY06_23485 [Deltaproteobacteria bacterium]|nr:hypothetical protein [Deltaproteobacteria bacterium]